MAYKDDLNTGQRTEMMQAWSDYLDKLIKQKV